MHAGETLEREAFRGAGSDIERELRPVPALEQLAVAVEGRASDPTELEVVGPSSSSPSRRQIGELPSQQPPDWTRISGPKVAVRLRSTVTAASVATTCCWATSKLIRRTRAAWGRS